jgi:lipopolysaccharide biosynthesis regulator YciM
MGLIYKYEKDTKSQIYYLSISASADIEMANRDNASFHDLALTYYDQQDFDRAFQFIEKAIDDAMLCKVRYRIIEGDLFLSYNQCRLSAENQ